MAPRTAFGLSVSALKARLRENPRGAFAFWGPEELLKQFYLQKFIDLVEKEGMAEFNLVRMDFTRNHTVDDLLGEAEILPFGGQMRLIVCRGLSPASMKEAEGKALLSLLENFPSYLTLIFYLEEGDFRVDSATLKKNIVKKLSEKMDFVSFPLQEERTLIPWAKKILSADSLEITDAVLRTLFRLSGSRMQIIRQELEKLSAWARSQNRGEICEEDVLLFARDTTEFAVFNLSDAVLEGKTATAKKILNQLAAKKTEPVLISATLSRMMTNALLICEGADATSCQKATNLQFWQYDRYSRSCYGKKKENLQKALAICLELDRKLKGDQASAGTSLELAVLALCALMGEKG